MSAPGPFSKMRTAPLRTIQNVGIEMANVYRRMKREEIDSSDGYRLVMVLAALQKNLEIVQVEKRLDELEAYINDRPDRPITLEAFTPRIVRSVDGNTN